MIAVATGLALAGNKVYTFTLQAFYLRAVEQIKDLVNVMKLPIFMVGCGKDKYYLREGITHWATEDKTIISQFKNIKIWDGGDIVKLIKNTLQSQTPFYIRLEK
jgi:transketolase C-terminal domain/subunit